MPGPHFFHHVVVFASDYSASEPFYTRALATLGIQSGHLSETGTEYWAEADDTPSFAVDTALTADHVTKGVHVAFEAEDRAQVDAFFEAAIAAGGTERHAPRHWPEYRAYCAFVSDPDGNNIEALVKEPTTS